MKPYCRHRRKKKKFPKAFFSNIEKSVESIFFVFALCCHIEFICQPLWLPTYSKGFWHRQKQSVVSSSNIFLLLARIHCVNIRLSYVERRGVGERMTTNALTNHINFPIPINILENFSICFNFLDLCKILAHKHVKTK